jgi:SagB-type dehydrogenase family enzyme
MSSKEDNLLDIAIFENSSCTLNEVNKSIAISSYSKSAADAKIKLAESYLINSYLDFKDTNANNSMEKYFTKELQLMQIFQDCRDFSDCLRIDLPKSLPLNMSLEQCIATRRSNRNFSRNPIDFTHLATLLHASAGLTAKMKINLLSDNQTLDMYLRASPSAGGLYPISLYVVPLNVEGLKFGAYLYSPIENAIFEIMNAFEASTIFNAFRQGKNELEEQRVSLLVIYSASPWRSMQKYGARGLRFVFHELGAISQNLNLVCVALGLGSLDYASFSEDKINQAFKLDGIQETILHTSLIGTPLNLD